MIARAIVAHGTVWMAASLPVGFLLSGLAELLRPALPLIAVAMLALSLARVEPLAVREAARDWHGIAAMLAFALLVQPLALILVLTLAGAPEWLATGLVLAAAAPPPISATAFAIMLGVDAALVTAIAIPGTLAAPVTILFVTQFLPLGEAGADIAEPTLRIAAMIAAGTCGAVALRALFRAAPRTGRAADPLMIVFVVAIGIAVMGEAGQTIRAEPGTALLLFGAVLALATTLAASGFLVLRMMPGADPFIAALVAGNRNMALMLAATIGAVDPRSAMVVLMAQLPLFLSPFVLKRLNGRSRPA
ncbi:hypothetical protein [Neoaquamicrobium sediminum]|uniref:hypothetical protein n=1 Tax=Neoaquamicrobium sediminum TaxID=1849104 RepID=UPI003BA9E3E9